MNAITNLSTAVAFDLADADAVDIQINTAHSSDDYFAQVGFIEVACVVKVPVIMKHINNAQGRTVSYDVHCPSDDQGLSEFAANAALKYLKDGEV